MAPSPHLLLFPIRPLWNQLVLPDLTMPSILARSRGARRHRQTEPERLQHLDCATVRSCAKFALAEPRPPEALAAIAYPLAAIAYPLTTVQLRRGEHPGTTAKP
jgi:hypothetical protein